MDSRLGITQILSPEQFTPFRAGASRLLETYQAVLLDDAHRTVCPRQNLRTLVENVTSCAPWLWVLHERFNPKRVLALGALDEVMPGQQAKLHGAALPGMKPIWGLNQMALTMMESAFGSDSLGLQLLIAEFETTNRGAQGFCRRMGFQKAAILPRHTLLQGSWQDVYRYVLANAHYQRHIRPRLWACLHSCPPSPQP